MRLLANGLKQVDARVREAAQMVEADSGASLGLTLAMQDLRDRSVHAVARLGELDELALQAEVAALERLADSARAAAEGDPDLAGGSRQAVVQLHR